MTIISVVQGERRIPWYWAVALLLPIGAVTLAAFFTPLLVWIDSQPPGSVIPPPVVIGVGTAANLSAFAVWRYVLLWLLKGNRQPTKVEPHHG